MVSCLRSLTLLPFFVRASGAFTQALSEYNYQVCTDNGNARIISINNPLPLTVEESIDIRTILSVLAGLFILIPYCYIPGAFIVFLVRERTTKAKHLQLVSGVNMSSYWVANYLWDVSLFFILTVLIMIIFILYGRSNAAVVFVGDLESFFCTMALTFGYGLSILPFSYLISLGFEYVLCLSSCRRENEKVPNRISILLLTVIIAQRKLR